jgi:hypothetical protein
MVIMTVIESRAKVQREPRRQLHKKPAWIMVDNGMTKRECFVMDVSPGGARIATDDAMDVRNKFELALCRIIRGGSSAKSFGVAARHTA